MSARHLKRSTLIAILVTLLLRISVGAADASGEADAEGNCTFARQLQDQSHRSEFMKRLAVAKEASTSRFGEAFAHTAQMKTSSGEIMEIDTFSVDCLSCHDGISAKGRDIRMKNSSGNRKTDIESVLGSHPIGMDYGSYAYAGNGFKRLGTLKKGMELIDGKVGCLTCHNPLNPKKNHLSVENNHSTLCYSCHQI